MPITFSCPCGKVLRVADEHAGRRVKCPVCNAVATVPAPEPQFEVVEEPEQLAPAPAKGRPVAKPASHDDDDDDDRGYSVAKTSRDDEDEPPRAKKKPDFRKGSGRTDDDEDEDEDEDRPKKKKKRKKRPPEQQETGRSFEGNVINGGVGVGILAMVGAIVWFVIGQANGITFFYPPVLFIIGLVAFFKGLTGEE